MLTASVMTMSPRTCCAYQRDLRRQTSRGHGRSATWSRFLSSTGRRRRCDRRQGERGVIGGDHEGCLAAAMGDTFGFALVFERKGSLCDRKRIVSEAIRERRGRPGGCRQQRKDGGGRVRRFMVFLLAEKGGAAMRGMDGGALRGRPFQSQRCSPTVLSPVRRTWVDMWPCCVPRRRLATAGSWTGRPRCCSLHDFLFCRGACR